MYNKILIRYGELSTKGKNKMNFVRQLERNIKELTGESSLVSYDRIFLEYKEKSLESLAKVFGISSYSPVIEVKTDLKAIENALLLLTSKTSEGSFKMAVKRHWKGFAKTSSELNAALGLLVVKNSQLTVKMKNPTYKIEVEVREKSTYIFFKRYKGLGGYPTGINGKVLHLISGGIDSPLAAFKLMKRGIHVDYLNFITPPQTDEKTVKKVSTLVKLLNKYQGSSKIYRVNYTKLMNLISLTSDQSYKITLMRRSFYRIASELAIAKSYLAISTGESLGQVASQTLESLKVISDEASLPVYRPVLTEDKLEIIDEAKKIGTYPISIEEASETCELFAPRAPVTKPKTAVAEKLEKELENILGLEKEAIKDIQKEVIKN